MDIGLIGAGAIANFLLKEVNQNQYGNLRIKSIFVRSKEKYQVLEKKFGVTLFTNLEKFLDSGIDIVVEAANIDAVKTLIPAVIKKKDVMLISVGALADEALLTEISNLIHKYKACCSFAIWCHRWFGFAAKCTCSWHSYKCFIDNSKTCSLAN